MTKQNELMSLIKKEIKDKDTISRAKCVRLAMIVYNIADPAKLYGGPYAAADSVLKNLQTLGIIKRKSRGIYIKI